jgi:hypothetical protein
MPPNFRPLLPFVALVFNFLPLDVHASGCVQETVVPIHFQPKAVCWQYSGTGNTFVGQFGAGQRITAAGIGESNSDDGSGQTLVEPMRLSLSISGPQNFSATSEPNADLDTHLGIAGQYVISISPCAAWGSEVMIKICAQTPAAK